MSALIARLRADAVAPELDEHGVPVGEFAGAGSRDRVLVDQIVASARARAMLEAREWVWMAELADRAESWVDREDWTNGPPGIACAADELAAALRLSPVTAHTRTYRAVQVRDRLPATLAAMGRGELDLGRVLAIEEATANLSDADARAVEALVLPGAGEQTAAELRAALRKAVLAVNPDGAERRRTAAVRGRGVARYQLPDRMGALHAVLSAVDSGELHDLLTEAAEQLATPGDTRTLDQRRADALYRLLTGRDPHLGPDDPPPPPDQPPPHPDDPPHPPDPADDADDVDDTDHADDADDVGDLDDPADTDEVFDGCERSGLDPADPGMAEPDDPDERFAPLPDPVAALAERAAALLAAPPVPPRRLPWVAINQTRRPDGTTVPVGELAGYGPITAHAARDLLSTGAARAPDPVTDRAPTPAQAARHDPPGWLDREIRARDGTCRFPGCRRPIIVTRGRNPDLDHTVAHPHGRTVRTNLAGLCRRHHNEKTAGLWQVSQAQHGRLTWTSTITGRAYQTTPRGTTGDWTGTRTLHPNDTTRRRAADAA